MPEQTRYKIFNLNFEFFFANYERTLPADFQFAQIDLARATLVLIRVLRTLINSIAKNLHKLQICLRFYSFYNKLDIKAIYPKILALPAENKTSPC